MQLQEIPSVCLRSMLQGARWPLTAAEAVFRRTDGEGPSEWPPAVAYEAFEASSKQVVGSLVRHRPLIEEGRAQQAKVDKLRMATALDSVADQRDVEAEQTFEHRRQADAERRQGAEAQAKQRKSQVASQKDQQHAKLEKELSRKASAAQRTAKQAKAAAAKRERAARSTRVTQERRALGKARKAVSAQARASDLERERQAARSARKGNRRSG
jgi:hypothetical protein